MQLTKFSLDISYKVTNLIMNDKYSQKTTIFSVRSKTGIQLQ